MIEIRDISFSYPDADILKNVTFTAESGEVVGLLGNNGAGKSTLVTCLNRIRKPKSGELFIDGKNAFQMSRNELARTVSYVAQKNELTHSTGHESRLNRLDRTAFFGTEAYSKEELIAEIGSAFLMNHIGIETTKTFKNSAAYIQSWLKVLRDDKRFIVSASSKAEKAMKYILGNMEENVVTA